MVEPGVGNPLEQPLMELPVLRGRSPPDHCRPVRTVGKKANHRVDEEIGPLLGTDAAEATYGVATGEAGTLEEVFGPGRGMKPLAVHSMHDNGVRHLQEPARAAARRDHGVHAPDEEAGDPGVMALGGRGEDEPQGGAADRLQDDPGQHLDISPGMPDAKGTALGTAQQPRNLPPPELRDIVRQSRTQRGDADVLGLTGNELSDRAGHPGEPPLEVRHHDLDLGGPSPHISPTSCCGRQSARCDKAYSLKPLHRSVDYLLRSAVPAPLAGRAIHPWIARSPGRSATGASSVSGSPFSVSRSVRLVTAAS